MLIWEPPREVMIYMTIYRRRIVRHVCRIPSALTLFTRYRKSLPKKKSCKRRWSCNSDIDKTTHGPIPGAPPAWVASMLTAPAGNTRVPPLIRTDMVHWNMLLWSMMSPCLVLMKLRSYFPFTILQLNWVTRRNVSPLSVNVLVERRKMCECPEIVITQYHPVSYWPARSQINQFCCLTKNGILNMLAEAQIDRTHLEV